MDLLIAAVAGAVFWEIIERVYIWWTMPDMGKNREFIKERIRQEILADNRRAAMTHTPQCQCVACDAKRDWRNQ